DTINAVAAALEEKDKEIERLKECLNNAAMSELSTSNDCTLALNQRDQLRAEVEKWHARAQGQSDIADHQGMEITDLRQQLAAAEQRQREKDAEIAREWGAEDEGISAGSFHAKYGSDSLVAAILAQGKGEK